MCGRPGALVQLMRLTLFLVVNSALAGTVVAHHSSGIGGEVEFARTVVNVRLQPPHASLIGGN